MSASDVTVQPTGCRWDGVRSPLADTIRRYLDVRRAMGCRFENEEYALRLLDRFLVHEGITCLEDISGERIDRFLASRQRDESAFNVLLGQVRRLFDWMVSQHELTSSPVQALPRKVTHIRLPYLYDCDTLRKLIAHAEGLADGTGCSDRGPTYGTIFAILATLGLRIGEVSRLTLGDVDLERDTLLIRNSKFGKSRIVPFGPRLAKRLAAYLRLREARLGPARSDSPLFSWRGRHPVTPKSIRDAFRHILPQLALSIPSGTARPCVHGMRHSFAVRTLLRWYREGLDPGARLNYLSTFLGHLNPTSTAVYLTITSELLQAANARFEAFARPICREEWP